MPAHDLAYGWEQPRRQSDNGRNHDGYDTFHHRRVVVIGRDVTTAIRVPSLNWPYDLFEDAQADATPRPRGATIPRVYVADPT